jgi:hypothetical protein
MAEKSIAIADACAALNSGVRDRAISLQKRDYSFAPDPVTKPESTRVFVRDGFTERW